MLEVESRCSGHNVGAKDHGAKFMDVLQIMGFDLKVTLWEDNWDRQSPEEEW